jgi:hypothetical protein
MFLLAAALATPTAAYPLAYVDADALRLRNAPGGVTLARLPINTELLVEETHGNWSLVSLAGRPAYAPLRGWVDHAWLAEAPLTVEGLLTAAAVGADPEMAVTLAERAYALDPGDARAHALLRELYAQVGDQDGVARLGRVAAGEDPVFLAACTHGRVVLGARWIPATGGISAPAISDVLAPAADALRASARTLGARAWYAITPGATATLVAPGTFAGAFVDYVHNASSPWIPLDPLDAMLPEGVVVLGACLAEGQVYATAPLDAVERSPLSATQLGVALDHTPGLLADAPLGLYAAAWGSVPWVDVRAQRNFRWVDCGGEGGDREITTWWLVEPAGGLVRRWGADYPSDVPVGYPALSYPTAGWFQLQGAETAWTLAAGMGLSPSSTTLTVVAVGPGGDLYEGHATLNSWGC